jgi:chromosome segregation ATPase
MLIKTVNVERLKQYSEKICFDSFSPSHNCIFVYNSSRKSKFHQSIEFVLLEEFSCLG